ncbi:hypothetical protein BDR26DRAFT_848947 [Obelidium mucronatum]|nr:hypothetical protein BDR26DRAFT_848947 [Obelidium mucronatum]
MKASECGLFLLHLLDVVQAEKEVLKSQCESLTNAGISQELELAEAKLEISHLIKKSKSLSNQLQASDTRISQLQSALEKYGSKPRGPDSGDNTLDNLFPSTSMQQDSKLIIRDLKKQAKQHASEKRHLETQIQQLKEDLVVLQCVSTNKQAGTGRSGSSQQGFVDDAQQTHHQQTDLLVALVRELTNANGKMEGECKELKALLEKSQQEVLRLASHMEELEFGLHAADAMNGANMIGGSHESFLDTSLAREILGDDSSALQMRGLDSEFDDSFVSDAGGVGSGSPKFGKEGFDSSSSSSIDILKGLEKGLSVSPSSSASEGRRGRPSAAAGSSASSTYATIRTLHSTAISIHARLVSTDTVSINRRLRRAFDLTELTRLSHSVLTNIEYDIQNLTTRFPSPSPRRSLSSQNSSDDILMIVDPMVKLVQILLGEIAGLRKGVNDLSLAYFEVVKRKAEESEINVAAKSPRLGSRSRSSSSGFDRRGLENGDTTPLTAGFQWPPLHNVLSNPGLIFGQSSSSPSKSNSASITSSKEPVGIPLPAAARSSSRGSTATRSPVLRETASLNLTSGLQLLSTTHVSVSQASVTSPAETDDVVDVAFDPPPDHPYWKTVSQEQIVHGINEEGVLGDPPPDHPFWKSRTRTVSASLGEMVGSLLSPKGKPPTA